MRKIKIKGLILLLIYLFQTNIASSQNYYWYKGEKKQIGKINPEKSICIVDTISHPNYLKIANKQKVNIQTLKSEHLQNNNFEKSQSHKRYCFIADGISKKAEFVSFSLPIYQQENGKELFTTDEFSVKLNKTEDFAFLKLLATKYKLEIIGSFDFMPLWYVLRCTKGTLKSPLELANIFYETGQFYASEPNFLLNIEDDCAISPNDTYFGDQWNLENIGQNGGVVGVDIKYCGASQITKGNASVSIGLIDNGIERNHVDIFNPYTTSQGYDMGTSSQPNQVVYSSDPDYKDYHGMSCAGIISAQNNTLGIIGIAPKCKLEAVSKNGGLQISNSFPINPVTFVNGLGYLYNENVGVISNSYHFDDLLQGHVALQQIEDAFTTLITNGRGGLGTVIVFSSGNSEYSTNASYPGNFHPDIITVGAINRCGLRVPKGINSCSYTANFNSQYGTKLDVVAPGVQIPTLDLMSVNGKNTTDYHLSFSGTSAAAPQVAALAGLMISLNKYLTQKDIVNVIESTCQKTGGYNYLTTSSRPNGTWHQEVGYGLINAELALNTVSCNTFVISNQIYSSDFSTSACEIVINNTSLKNTGTDVIVKSKNLVINSLEIPLGTSFTAEILNY